MQKSLIVLAWNIAFKTCSLGIQILQKTKQTLLVIMALKLINLFGWIFRGILI